MATATRLETESFVDGKRPFRLTSEQYHDMAERGWFEGKRVELIKGEIIEMSPMKSPHWAGVVLVDQALHSIFESGYVVSTQLPLKLEDGTEPEPDLAIIPGQVRDYLTNLPHTASLIVEVADSTLATDRSVKGALYASAGIPEYWIVNINDRVLEVRRVPADGRYESVEILTLNESVSPLAAPDAAIAVADLLL